MNAALLCGVRGGRETPIEPEEEGIAHAAPMPVITSALFARFSSSQDDSPQMRAGVLTDH